MRRGIWWIHFCLWEQVDISTMLEEAVQYVKFLQIQIKVFPSLFFQWSFLVRELGNLVISVFYYPTAFKLWWIMDVCSHCLQWDEHWSGLENRLNSQIIIVFIHYSSMHAAAPFNFMVRKDIFIHKHNTYILGKL